MKTPERRQWRRSGVFRSHPLSAYAIFSEKVTFRLEIFVFRKILRTYLIDDPLLLTLNMFEHISHLLVFLLLILSRQMPAGLPP